MVNKEEAMAYCFLWNFVLSVADDGIMVIHTDLVNCRRLISATKSVNFSILILFIDRHSLYLTI